MNNLTGLSLSTVSLGFSFSVPWPEIWALVTSFVMQIWGLPTSVAMAVGMKKKKSNTGLPWPLGTTDLPVGDEVCLFFFPFMVLGTCRLCFCCDHHHRLARGAGVQRNRKKEKHGRFCLYSLSEALFPASLATTREIFLDPLPHPRAPFPVSGCLEFKLRGQWKIDSLWLFQEHI